MMINLNSSSIKPKRNVQQKVSLRVHDIFYAMYVLGSDQFQKMKQKEFLPETIEK